MEQKERAILVGLITLAAISFLIVLSGYYNQVKELKQEVKLLKEKNYTDSVLVSEYQEAFHILYDKNKMSAEDFSKIMDSLNCE